MISRSFSKTHALLAIATLSILTLAFIFFLVGSFTNDEKLLIVSAGFIPFLIVLFFQLTVKGYDVFHPLSFVALSVLLGTTIRSAYIATSDSWFVKGHLLMGQPVSALFPGLTAIAVSMLFVGVGFVVISTTFPRRSNGSDFCTRQVSWSIRRVRTITAWGVIIGWIFIGVYLWRVGIEEIVSSVSVKRRFSVESTSMLDTTSLTYLTAGASLIYAAILFRLAAFWQKNRNWSWMDYAFGVVALCGAFVVPVVASSRGTLGYFFVYLLMVFHYFRKRVTFFSIFLAAAGVVLLLATLGVARQIGQGSEHIGSSSHVLEDVYQNSVGNRHFLGVAKTAHIMDGVPEKIDYQLGKTLFSWLWAPVPRELWPDKPVIRIGGVLGKTIFEQGKHTGTPPGFVGEMYLNAGWFGIVVGSFLWGGLLARIRRTGWHKPNTPENRKLVYIFCVLPLGMIMAGSDVSGAVLMMLQYLVPLAIVHHFCRIPAVTREPHRRIYASSTTA